MNRGFVAAAAPVSVCPGVNVVDLPSRWHELQLALPLKRLYPAISSDVRVYFSDRKASNFDVNGLRRFERSYLEMDCPQWS